MSIKDYGQLCAAKRIQQLLFASQN